MKEEIKKFNKKLCAASAFIAVIAYVLVSYYTGCWTWTLFIFLIIPLLPVITGLKKITFEVFVVVIYLILGFGFHLWHPYWVIFLLIPIYHIFFDNIGKRISKKVEEFSKENEDIKIHIDEDLTEDNVEVHATKDENGKTIITVNKKHE